MVAFSINEKKRNIKQKMDDPTDFLKKKKKTFKMMKKLTNEELTHHHIIVSNREEEKKEKVEIRNVPSSSAIVFCVM